LIKEKLRVNPKKVTLVYQIKITLRDTEPPVWRLIQVPSSYSFWDLHVAIQDAMGWTDSHLHMFRVSSINKRKEVNIGIPDENFDDIQILAGWEIPLSLHFREPGAKGIYEYDFGDSWEHDVLLEGVLIPEAGAKYPRCLAGANACPPEDCGGIGGYYNLLETIRDPLHEEYEESLIWLKSMVPGNVPFDSTKFAPEEVHFDNPKKRLRSLHV
jgi:hypothetical protein